MAASSARRQDPRGPRPESLCTRTLDGGRRGRHCGPALGIAPDGRAQGRLGRRGGRRADGRGRGLLGAARQRGHVTVKSHWPSGPRPTDGAAASISGRGQEGVLRADAPGRGHAGRTEFRREQVRSLCSSGPQERARADTGWTGPRLRTDLGAIAEQFEAPRSRRQWVWTEGSRGQGPGLRQARVRHGGDPPRGGSWWGGAGEGDAPLCPRTLSRVAGRGQVGRGSRKGPAGPGRGPGGRDGGVRPVSSASAFCSREAENSGGD